MKEKTLSVSCTYSEAGPLVVDLIRESFRFFLKKELVALDIRGDNLTIWPQNIIIFMMNGRLSQEV